MSELANAPVPSLLFPFLPRCLEEYIPAARALHAVKSLLKEVLCVAREGPLTPQTLVERLGVSREEAEALIGALLSHGYIREVNAELCPSCPLKSGCPLSGRIGSIKVYELTEKGRSLIESRT